jgi:hypothetical protein
LPALKPESVIEWLVEVAVNWYQTSSPFTALQLASPSAEAVAWLRFTVVRLQEDVALGISVVALAQLSFTGANTFLVLLLAIGGTAIEYAWFETKNILKNISKVIFLI